MFLILTEYREAYQFAPLTGDEMEIRINSWLPVTAPIPVGRLRDCYAWAMQNRNSQFPLSAVELVDAWKHLVQRAETEGSSKLRDDRLLPANAAEACGRCYKRKEGDKIVECLEINSADGSLMGPCDHRPLTTEEQAQATQKRVDFLADMRAQARRNDEARRKAEGEARAKADAEKPKGKRFQCSKCERTVTTLAGWTAGEPCNIQLTGESAICPKCGTETGALSLGRMICRECLHSYEIVICDGKIS